MVMRAADAVAHAKWTLGGEVKAPSAFSWMDVANYAGEWLVAAASWRFLEGATADLDFTANQDYVALPADCAEVLAIDRPQGNNNGFGWTTHEGLLDLRANMTTAASGQTWGVVTHGQDADGGKPTPRIDLHPTPTSSSSGALKIRYRRGWKTLTDDQQHVSLPSWVELLYRQAIAAVARGLVEEDVATPDERLATVRGGFLFAAALRRDHLVQPSFGVLTGGMAQMSGRRKFFDPTVTGP